MTRASFMFTYVCGVWVKVYYPTIRTNFLLNFHGKTYALNIRKYFNQKYSAR
jgi:hypothetical protein